MNRRAIGMRAFVLLASITFLGACSGSGDDDVATTTTSAPAIETTTTTEVAIDGGEQIFVYEPVIGDCFDLRKLEEPSRSNNDQVDIVLKLDCALPHQFEVFDVIPYTNDYVVFPGDSALESFAKQNCTKNFDGYIGQAYELSELEISFWTTPSAQWDEGPQPFACTVFDPDSDVDRTAGSLAGSAR